MSFYLFTVVMHTNMLCLKLSLVYLCFVSLAVFARTASEEDRVTILPGLRIQPSFRHYSGYLDGHRPGVHLHYWFVESEGRPSEDPLVLWMNGGPGCSSMEGLLSEHGPFRITDGAYLVNNPNAWNRHANVLYLEAPAGVGFSYADDKRYATDDDKTSLDNVGALKSFFLKFPEFKRNEFYISGESYGGIYVPTLAIRVMAERDINLKGVAIGNGLGSWRLNDNSIMYFGYYHGLIGDVLWGQLIQACCNGSAKHCDFHSNPSLKCQQSVARARIEGNGLDVYNMYAPCWGGLGNRINTSLTMDMSHGGQLVNHDLGTHFRKNSFVKAQRDAIMPLRNAGRVRTAPPCVNITGQVTYLNKPIVRYALHIPAKVQPYDVCSDEVSRNYKTLYEDMFAQYRHIIAAKKYRILVFNGDIDMACNYLGDQWFVNQLNLTVKTDRTKWFYMDENKTKQIGGWYKRFAEGLTFMTVRGAGHMVPQDKPLQAFHLFNSFLKGISP